MKKRTVLLITIVATLLFFFIAIVCASEASEEKIGSAVSMTATLIEQGFEFTSGHWLSESRTFQKMTDHGRITVIMSSDEKGEEIKSLFISMPAAMQRRMAEDIIKESMAIAPATHAQIYVR